MPYSPTTWVNGSSPPISAANLNHLELALKAAYPIYNVLDSAYGAVGNGSTDDTTAVQAAITAAQGTGGRVYSPPGYTYMIASPLTITAACSLDFSGSTLKRGTGWASTFGTIIQITAANVEVKNLILDGNRATVALGGGLFVDSGGAAICRNVKCLHHRKYGFIILNGGTLDAYDCEATDNNAGDGTADGFVVGSSGLLRTYGNCVATLNDRAGFNFGSDAADGCRLKGRAYQNNTGAILNSDLGHCESFISEQANAYGLSMGGGGFVTTGWTSDYLETNNTGVSVLGLAVNPAGTGVELFGVDHCNFGTVVSKKNFGYGVALTTNGTVGSTYNTFHSVTCDQTGAGDTDPGIVLSGFSTNNEFGNASIIGHSVGIVIGETSGGNNDNAFGTVYIANNLNGGITINGGTRNTFQNVVSRNNKNGDLSLASKGVVSFNGSGASVNLNVIGFLDHDDSGTDHTTVPAYLAYSDSTAVNNSILDGFARSTRVSAIDLNGGNSFFFRRPQRRTSLSTLDSGETWSSSTNQTTNQRFMEGNGGKRVVGGTDAYTVSQRTGLSLNLSSTADSDWFRVFAYVENVTDFNGANPSVELVFLTSPGNYYAVGWDYAMMNNGAQWLYARKGAFGPVGTPSWASITTIQFLVWGHTATAAASFDDLIIAETKWDRTSTIGQNNTPAAITTGASPFVYQNLDGVPLNVMVSGGTVSAIDYSQDSSTFYSQGQTAGIFIVNPNDYTRVTYSVAPTMTKVPTR